jgi:hypothetical protein
MTIMYGAPPQLPPTTLKIKLRDAQNGGYEVTRPGLTYVIPRERYQQELAALMFEAERLGGCLEIEDFTQKSRTDAVKWQNKDLPAPVFSSQ